MLLLHQTGINGVAELSSFDRYLFPLQAQRPVGTDYYLLGGRRGSRTLTTFRPVDFKSTASTIPPFAHITLFAPIAAP